MVWSRYDRGAVEVRFRSRCASGSVRFVNFSTGDTVYRRQTDRQTDQIIDRQIIDRQTQTDRQTDR